MLLYFISCDVDLCNLLPGLQRSFIFNLSTLQTQLVQYCPQISTGWVDEIQTHTLYQKIRRELSRHDPDCVTVVEWCFSCVSSWTHRCWEDDLLFSCYWSWYHSNHAITDLKQLLFINKLKKLFHIFGIIAGKCLSVIFVRKEYNCLLKTQNYD